MVNTDEKKKTKTKDDYNKLVLVTDYQNPGYMANSHEEN